jgi:glycosyltransferase involved in cell wall biosynthesis
VTARRIGYVLGTTQGGTGRHVAMLADGCVQAGREVSAFGPAKTAELFGAGVRFGAVAISDRPRPATDAIAVLRLRALLRRTRPDVVHGHGLRAGAVAALALHPVARAGRGRTPALVVTVHNAAPAGARAAAVYRVLERIVASRADAVLCVSPDLEERMRALGARRVDRAIVAAPSPPDRVRSVPDQTAPPDPGGAALPADIAGSGRPVVLAVGRLAPQKGFDTLLTAATRWLSRNPEPALLVAGTGPLGIRLLDQARDLGVDARFLGPRDDVPALLAAADVFVLPSNWEGQPLVLQEALLAGVPIVATDVGGVRVLTGDQAAVLVPAGDPGALAGAVRRVLDDAGFAAALRRAAAARAQTLPTAAEAAGAALALYDTLS